MYMGGGSRKASVVWVGVFLAAAMVLSFGFAGAAVASDDDSGHGNECDGVDEDNPGNDSSVSESALENRQNNSDFHSACGDNDGDDSQSNGTYTLFVNVTNESNNPIEANVSVEDDGTFTNETVTGNESVGEFANGTYNVTAWANGYTSNSTQVTIDGSNETVTIVLSPIAESGSNTGNGGGGSSGGGGSGGGAGPVDSGDDVGVDDDGGDTGADDSGDADDGAGADGDGDAGTDDGNDGDGGDGDGAGDAGDDGDGRPQEEAALVPQVLLIFLVGLILVVGAAAVARQVLA